MRRPNRHSLAPREGIRDATVTQPNPPRVTHDHWVYLCYDADGHLIYIGITGRGLRRLAHEHAKRAQWARHVAHIDVEHYPTVEEAIARERLLIGDLNPIHNIQRPGSRAYMIPDPPFPRRWLSIDDLADWLTADRAWVEHKMDLGMPHAIIADMVRFNAEEVVSWLRG